MKTFKEWVEDKNNSAQFIIDSRASRELKNKHYSIKIEEIVLVWRISDGRSFGCGDSVIYNSEEYIIVYLNENLRSVTIRHESGRQRIVNINQIERFATRYENV